MTELVVYGAADLARILSVHPETARRWLASGRLPGRKVGGLWFTTDEQLRDYLQSGGAQAHEAGAGVGLPAPIGRALGGGHVDRPEGQADEA